MYIVVILAYLVLGFYELVPLIQRKMWRDLISNIIIMCVSFITAILLSLGIDLPSPEEPIREVILRFRESR